jgi:hypothetical protein
MQPAVAELTSVIKRVEARTATALQTDTHTHTEETGYLLAYSIHKDRLSFIFNILNYKLRYTRGIRCTEDCPSECDHRMCQFVCKSTMAGWHCCKNMSTLIGKWALTITNSLVCLLRFYIHNYGDGCNTIRIHWTLLKRIVCHSNGPVSLFIIHIPSSERIFGWMTANLGNI